jgi:hypothetical protein
MIGCCGDCCLMLYHTSLTRPCKMIVVVHQLKNQCLTLMILPLPFSAALRGIKPMQRVGCGAQVVTAPTVRSESFVKSILLFLQILRTTKWLMFLSYHLNHLHLISLQSELECWAFTSCKEEKGIETPKPIPTSAPTITVQYVPGFGGAQVPVFGGVDWSLLQPSISPVPSFSSQPIDEPAVSASDLLGTYFCGG